MTAIIPATVPAQRPAPDDPAEPTWRLVERAQAGDREAFGRIYDLHLDRVFRYIYHRVGRSRVVAEDLTADVFLRALRNIGRVTWQGRDIGAWLITIARNLVADHYKCGYYPREVLSAAVGTSEHEHEVADTSIEGDPEKAAVDTLTSEALHAALAELNPHQRRCLQLRFLQGLNVEETAHAMGREVGAVKALQFRATRALRHIIGDTLS